MKNLLAAVATVALVAAASPVLATDIIVVAHGQANDPFWSVVKNAPKRPARIPASRSSSVRRKPSTWCRWPS